MIFLLMALVHNAWRVRFILDDALIQYRYADNLVAGEGLVWNDD